MENLFSYLNLNKLAIIGTTAGPFDNLNLVGLASFGVAGVSVLMVFIIGYYILKLSNDSPPWKVKLMRTYIFVCLITAFICAASGIGNALIDHKDLKDSKENLQISKGETKKIETKYNELEKVYIKEEKKAEDFKQDISSKINNANIKEEEKIKLNNKVSNYKVIPYDEIKTNIEKMDAK